MKNINDLKPGQNVIFSSLEPIFTVKQTDVETGKVTIFIKGTDIERKTDIKNIYPVTRHVLKVSKFTRETRDNVKTMIPFGININDEIMKKAFLNHWIRMCEVEGNKKTLKIVQENFKIFVAKLEAKLAVMKQLNVNGITLIAPMIPNLED